LKASDYPSNLSHNKPIMSKYTFLSALILSVLFIFSCGEKKNTEAIQYLDNIRSLYSQGKYQEALDNIDNIQTLYPKAFSEIKEAMALKQDVRKASDEREITVSDSLLKIYEPQIDSIKKLFVYQKDEEDETGIFIPKSVNTNHITSTMLRSGVNENGTFYLESTYIGGQFHNQIEVSTKDKRSAESLPIDDEGFNFRFSNLGNQYEVIKVTPFHDNGLAKFILENADSPLTVKLKGKNTTSFSLSNIHKKAIVDSYSLSALLLKKDSLFIAKDKAQTRIKYLESKATEVQTGDKENSNSQ